MTITINRSDLEPVMMGQTSFDQQIAAGKARLQGDRRPYDLLKSLLVQFKIDFQILPGTGGTRVSGGATAEPDPFRHQSGAINSVTD